MRRGREFYSDNYSKAMDLGKQGLAPKEIASKLGISYSCVYHWIRGLRKPAPGNLKDFEKFLRRNGPTAVIDIKDKFPKHNELFLTASRRGMKIRRHVLKRKFGEYSTWYFVEGQENDLKKSLEELSEKYRQVMEKLVG